MSVPLHVSVVDSAPPAGTPVAGPIGEVQVTFDGEVGADSSLEVLDSGFARVHQGPTRVESENTLAVDVSDSASGELSVQYSAVDPHDGYASTGALTLNVLPAALATPPEAPPLGVAALALVAVGAAVALAVSHRRDRAAVGLVVLVALLTACDGSASTGDAGAIGAPTEAGQEAHHEVGDAGTPRTQPAPAASMTVILASSDLATGPERFAYGLRSTDGAPIEAVPSSVTFFRIEGEKATPADTVEATYYPSLAEGQPGLYVARTSFDSPGPWGAEVRVAVGTDLGASGPSSGQTPASGVPQNMPAMAQRVRFEVAAQPASPALGEAPPPTANKTTPADASAQDLAAITSDPAPDPQLYEVTVDDARASGRPTVVVFATPAYCQTELCGPIVDEIKQVKAEWGDRVNFIHIEVYDTFDPLVVSPIMASWGLSTEPWVFVLDADGNVSARLEGNVTAAELVPVLESLVGSSP